VPAVLSAMQRRLARPGDREGLAFPWSFIRPTTTVQGEADFAGDCVESLEGNRGEFSVGTNEVMNEWMQDMRIWIGNLVIRRNGDGMIVPNWFR
jgi:hypothetical protein